MCAFIFKAAMLLILTLFYFLTLPDISALHSWHIALLRSKKHHTADILPPARNVFYCTKVQLTKVLVLKNVYLQIRLQVTKIVRHF